MSFDHVTLAIPYRMMNTMNHVIGSLDEFDWLMEI